MRKAIIQGMKMRPYSILTKTPPRTVQLILPNDSRVNALTVEKPATSVKIASREKRMS